MNRGYLLFWIMVVVVGYVGVRYIKNRIINILPTTSIFFFDKQWSSDLCKKIEAKSQEYYAECKNPEIVIQKVLQDFPQVKSMHVELCDADKICFHMHSNQPLCVVNKSVVYADGTLVDIGQVDSTVLQTLLHIKAVESWAVSPVLHFSLLVPKSMYDLYSFEWISEFEIIIRKKDGVSPYIITWFRYIPNMDYLKAIFDLYSTLPKNKKNNKDQAVFDVRFEKQLIVRAGGNYDKGISFVIDSN